MTTRRRRETSAPRNIPVHVEGHRLDDVGHSLRGERRLVRDVHCPARSETKKCGGAGRIATKNEDTSVNSCGIERMRGVFFVETLV